MAWGLPSPTLGRIYTVVTLARERLQEKGRCTYCRRRMRSLDYRTSEREPHPTISPPPTTATLIVCGERHTGHRLVLPAMQLRETRHARPHLPRVPIGHRWYRTVGLMSYRAPTRQRPVSLRGRPGWPAASSSPGGDRTSDTARRACQGKRYETASRSVSTASGTVCRAFAKCWMMSRPKSNAIRAGDDIAGVGGSPSHRACFCSRPTDEAL